MKTLRQIASVASAAVLCLPASGQGIDTPATPGSSSGPAAVAARPAPQTPPGASKAVLAPFGPYVTLPGGGAGGADLSELYVTACYNTLGWSFQFASGNLIADDFVVPAGETWNVSTVKWLAYQTNAPTTGTITGLYLNLWGPGNDPTGQLGGGHDVTGGDQILSQVWTGVYRASDTAPTGSSRAIIEATASGAWLPPLSAGTYWMEASASGSLTSGPWAPPVVVVGQVPGGTVPYNAVHSLGGGVFGPADDDGSTTCPILPAEPVDFLFQVEGSSGGGSIVYCTSRPSSIAGCTPTLSATTTQITKGAAGSVPATAGPVPGGNSPGILIFGKNLAPAPIVVNFGELCLQGFNRAPTTIAGPGGTSGSCSGSYTFDLQLAINNATAAQAAPGDTVYFQGWYRDTPNPFGANLTNAIGDFSIL